MSNYNHRRRLVPPGVPPPSSPRNLATSPNGNAGVPPAPQATLSNAERRAMKRVVGGGLKENIDSILEEEMHQQNAPKSPYHPEQISQPETSQPPANSAIKAEPTVKQSSVIGSFIKQIGIKSSALMGGESSSNATEHPPKEIKIKITEPDPHSAKEDPPMLNEQLSPTDGLSPREVHSEDSHSGEDAVSPRGSDNTNSSKELTSPTKTRNTGNKKPLSNSVDLRLPTLKSFFSSSKTTKKKSELIQIFQHLAEQDNVSNTTLQELQFERNEENIMILIKAVEGREISAKVKKLITRFAGILAYPTEQIPGIRKKYAEEGFTAKLLPLGVEGAVQVYRHIEFKELTMGDLIAKGASGVVYQAKWEDKDVAVKVCGKMKIFYGTLEEFRFEATAMSLLDHVNILPCYGANEKHSEPFIVFPLKARGTLESILYSMKLSLSMKLHLAMKIAEGLNYIHKCGLIHRDLKPSNILIGDDFEPSLIDFGVSCVEERARVRTMNVGTTAWIAPEMFEGSGNYTNAVDVYSYSLILYELVTQEKPFSDLRGFEIPIKVSSGHRPTIPEGCCPPELSQIIQQSWQGQPKKRPTMKQVWTKLKEIQDQSLWTFSQPVKTAGTYSLISQTHHPCAVDYLAHSDNYVWVANTEGTVAIYKYSLENNVPKMVINQHYPVESSILNIICVPTTKRNWLFTHSGEISITDNQGVLQKNEKTNQKLTTVTLIECHSNAKYYDNHENGTPYAPVENDELIYTLWMGCKLDDEGNNSISIWDVKSESIIFTLNFPEKGEIKSIAQYQQYVLVGINQSIYAVENKLNPTIHSVWRVFDDNRCIDCLKVFDSERQNLWIVDGEKSIVYLWECRTIVENNFNGISLTNSEIYVNQSGKIKCLSQVRLGHQDIITVWTSVSDPVKGNHLQIRNGKTMSILQTIPLPDTKIGTSVCVIDNIVLVGGSGCDEFESGSILCLGLVAK